MESGAIPDDRITASSFYEIAFAPYRGRLNEASGSWAAQASTIGEWLQVDIERMKRVTGTVIQGRHNSDQWVASYKVQYSADGINWSTYAGSEGSEKVFPGNTDRSTPVTNLLDNPVEARYVRFYPQSWYNWITMRAEILVCRESNGPCYEMKLLDPRNEDGVYTIYPFSACQNVPISVYCHNMASGNPEE
ncbi:PREDICTED: lactadherin-like, partial [Branchiostoma belcheri]|uniref:Lactadherin-like n=1 Tax=Branchiostoma belcheri TaxID=7741 RepID=A0A6P4YXS1_BRABE